MADAPAQSKQDIEFKRKKEKGEKYWKEARDGFFTDLDWKQELDIFMKENSDTNIFCFHLQHPQHKDWAKENFEEIAKIGNGKSIYLDIGNQDKSVNLLQGALSELILYKINNGNMDIVEKFRKEHRNLTTFL